MSESMTIRLAYALDFASHCSLGMFFSLPLVLCIVFAYVHRNLSSTLLLILSIMQVLDNASIATFDAVCVMARNDTERPVTSNCHGADTLNCTSVLPFFTTISFINSFLMPLFGMVFIDLASRSMIRWMTKRVVIALYSVTAAVFTFNILAFILPALGVCDFANCSTLLLDGGISESITKGKAVVVVPLIYVTLVGSVLSISIIRRGGVLWYHSGSIWSVPLIGLILLFASRTFEVPCPFSTIVGNLGELLMLVALIVAEHQLFREERRKLVMKKLLSGGVIMSGP
mmetsp:Transcript_8861/g.24047  ORF Transcript_8861/g.24047 Transcript_8861/m.24047 type:complete len:286 (-) Transcript_8861:1166-2023(-)